MDHSIDRLGTRHSVRSYQERALPDGIVNALRSEITYINTHEAGFNFQLCIGDDAPMKGFIRSYGMFRNVSDYMVPVIDPSFAASLERAGYYSEQFVMECVDRGLGTCFVGGTFSRSHVNAMIEVYERVPFIVVFGYPDTSRTTFLGKLTARMAHREKRDPRKFYAGNDVEYEQALAEFPWLYTALRAVAYAPSALNTQPVRLRRIKGTEFSKIAAFTTNPDKYEAELGIAKFNVAAAVGGVWEWGEGGTFTPD